MRSSGGSAAVVVERALGELADDVEPPDRLELEVEVVEQVDDELLGLAARAARPSGASACACASASCARFMLDVAEDRAADRDDREHRADRGDLPRAHQRLARRALALALRRELALGLVARLALEAQRRGSPCTTPHSTSCVSSTRRTSSRSSMRSSRRLTSVASASGRRAGRGERLLQRAPRRGSRGSPDSVSSWSSMTWRTPARLVGERALVELGEDRVARAGEQVGGDLGAALRDARVVELAADERQQRRLDLGVAQLRAAGDEAHDRLGDLLGDEPAAGLHHGGERLLRRSSARAASGSA